MSSTSPPAATTPPAAPDSSSDSAIPLPRRLVWSDIRAKGSKSPKADKDRAKAIFDWMKAECLPLVIAQERESKESAGKAGRRDKYIQHEIYPKVDRQFEISGPNGFVIGDFQKQIVKCFSNWIREAKAADAKAEAKVGLPLPATVGGEPPSKVKVAPRLRKKNALDMYKKDYRTDIRQAVADAKAKAKAAAKARGEEEEEDDDDDDGDDDDDDDDGQDGVKVEEGAKAKRLTLFNSLAAKLFEGVGADIKEAMEVRAKEVNAELVKTPTEDIIVQNQDRLGDTIYGKMTRLIGHGPKQVGDAVFHVRWAVKRPDGRLKYMRLSIAKNSLDIRFKEGQEQDVLFRSWARSNLHPEAPADLEADLEQDTTPPPPPPAPAAPSASTSGPANELLDKVDPPVDFSPGMLKLAPVARPVLPAPVVNTALRPSPPALPPSTSPVPNLNAAGGSGVAPSALPGPEMPPVVVAAAAAGDVAGAGAAAGGSGIAPSALPGPEMPPVVVAAAAAGDVAGAGASGAGIGGKKGKKAKGKGKAIPKAKPAAGDAHTVKGAKRKADGDAEGAPAPKKMKKAAAVVAPAVTRPKRTKAGDDKGTLTAGRREGIYFYTLNSPLLPAPYTWEDDFVVVYEYVKAPMYD
ncbi:hypothetical protein DFH06DRAFT_1316026 [Mycena polygramma]|nr:hypothetical protein DFH06DRAFT_1336074 [Mycena polygramma]KAJ7679079.1 hypothetical protein DFH06DRAFT_1316026 [Mycena polygramma]